MKEFPDLGGNIEKKESHMEIEQKYLLTSKEDAERLMAKIVEMYPEGKKVAYFETAYYFPKMNKVKALELLLLVIKDRAGKEQILSQMALVPESTPFIVRIRRRKTAFSTEITLTLKASSDPLHDTERVEIEVGEISDSHLEGFETRGVEVESKWRSHRFIYEIGDEAVIDVENVTGYGWKAEIEAGSIEKVNDIADKLGLTPVDPKLLDAMYKYYKDNWRKFCGDGDDKYFTEDDKLKISSTLSNL